ncbi:hypothetical protein IWQ61_009489, partial [Dispira simplex]
FETKSNRVKGLAFHPKRPWILAALHNGCVQLWDYRMGTLLERFDEHEGPVRGVAFHPTQNLFVTGGDDFKIKLWNHKTRRCLFTLNGHMDYIRTVAFHHELPWILSASDDQTIRIWNWQSRQCIAILPGHTHYVMCAQFHPDEDLIVSACLDETIRVWDYSGLRKKSSAGAPTPYDDMNMHPSHRALGGQPDLFGNTDVYVKFVLEGHTRGVNWASFHPTMPLIVSGGDDRQIKVWRMNESKAWEVDSCRGHFNNVSCVLFHPHRDLIVSNSEDRTIRVWDGSRRTLLQTYHRDHEKFWIMTAHPTISLFAAGHDGGLMVFKLERERPAFTCHQQGLFYAQDEQMRYHKFNNEDDHPLATLRQVSEHRHQAPARTVSYNPAEHTLLVTYPTDGGIYEIYHIPNAAALRSGESQRYQRGSGYAAVWISRNRFAVLDRAQQQVLIKDLSNSTTKTIPCPSPATDIFAGPGSILLMSTATSVLFYDVQQRKVAKEVGAAPVKYVVWNHDMSMAALLCKHTVTLVNKAGDQLGQISETIRIKSGAWDESGVLLYTTLNHLKYSLSQRGHGTICTLEHPIYLTQVQGGRVHCLNREAEPQVITIDPTEYRFKLALIKRNYDQVIDIIRNSNLVGQSIIAYLQKQGYPEIALHFVKESTSRFELAIACGNLEVALEAARALDREEYWLQLATEALKLGRLQTVELAYQQVKNYDRLSFLYLITGNTDKLQKMMKIAEIRGDASSRFHNGLYLGKIDERIRILKELKQYSLAYAAARAHGLEEEAESILTLAGVDPEDVELPAEIQDAMLLMPPAPVYRQTELNWPLLAVPKSVFDKFFAGEEGGNTVNLLDDQATAIGGDWGVADDLDIPGLNIHDGSHFPTDGMRDLIGDEDVDQLADPTAWGIDADLDLPAEDELAVDSSARVAASVEAPARGTRESELWSRNSSLAVDHIAAGSFRTAMQLLKQQAGVVNFAPLKTHFMTIYQTTQTYVAADGCTPALYFGVRRTLDETQPHKLLPAIAYNFHSATAQIQEGLKKTTGGRFQEAIEQLRAVLQFLLFSVVATEVDKEEVQGMVAECREYLVGLSMERARQELAGRPDQVKRVLELSAYFTHCVLQPIHQQLALRSAMVLHYKQKNFMTASSLVRRLLELAPAQSVATQARQIQTLCDRNSRDEVTLEYDQYNPFVVCAATFSPLYKNTSVTYCAYCQASYKPEFAGHICRVCEVAEVGFEGTGFRTSA